MNKDAAKRLLDRGGWKHSWHLPKDTNGNTLWYDDRTIDKVRQQVAEAKEEAIDLIRMCDAIGRLE